MIVGALVVALVVKTFLFQAFYIPSESMEPTLERGDRVLVNKLSYDLHDVNRGDVIVFELDDEEVGHGRHPRPHQAGHRPARRHDRDRATASSTSTIGSFSEPYLPEGTLTGDPSVGTTPPSSARSSPRTTSSCSATTAPTRPTAAIRIEAPSRSTTSSAEPSSSSGPPETSAASIDSQLRRDRSWVRPAAALSACAQASASRTFAGGGSGAALCPHTPAGSPSRRAPGRPGREGECEGTLRVPLTGERRSLLRPSSSRRAEAP